MTAEPPPGLCESCRHARELTTANGGKFYQCLLAAKDLRFPKWPRIPVLSCPGHEVGEGEKLA